MWVWVSWHAGEVSVTSFWRSAWPRRCEQGLALMWRGPWWMISRHSRTQVYERLGFREWAQRAALVRPL